MRRLIAAVVAGVAAAAMAPAASASASTLNIVALGDSSASGVGAGDYEPGTEGKCFHSANSYTADLVASLRAKGRTVSFTNVTCSGAAIPDLRRTFQDQPPQLDSLKRDTDIVTLTIGGNDIDLASFAGLCIQGDCSGAPADATIQRLDAMGQDLRALLKEVKSRSPRAQVVVTGYGRQITDGANAQGVPLDPICGDGIITAPERTDGSRIATALDARLRSVTAGLGTYVSEFAYPGYLRPSFAGHSLCEAGPSFYRGFDALAPGQEGPVAVLHLNKAGHATLASLIEAKLCV